MIKAINIDWLVELIYAREQGEPTLPPDLQAAFDAAYIKNRREGHSMAQRAGLRAFIRAALDLPASNQPPLMDEDDIHLLLKARCADRKQKDVAEELGISTQYLTDLLYRRRNISNEIAAKFGYERRVVFVPIDLEATP